MPFSLGFWANNTVPTVPTWSMVNAPDTAVLDWQAVAYKPLANGSWFLRQNATVSTATYYYSTNGTSWTSGSLPAASTRWRLLIAGSDRVVALRSLTGTGGVAYSTNGTTWTLANFASIPNVFYQGIFDGTRFLAVGIDASGAAGLFYSTDSSATSWGNINLDGGYSIGFDGTSRYVILEGSTSAFHKTCTSDPTISANWTSITLPSSEDWTSVVYGNGVWLATKSSGTGYATSTDGTTWTSRTLPSSVTTDLNNKAFFANGKFYYVAGNNDTLYSSTTGTGGWTSTLTSSLDIAKDWAYSGDTIIGVGSRPTTGQYIQGLNV